MCSALQLKNFPLLRFLILISPHSWSNRSLYSLFLSVLDSDWTVVIEVLCLTNKLVNRKGFSLFAGQH